jgi:hypothetical protein
MLIYDVDAFAESFVTISWEGTGVFFLLFSIYVFFQGEASRFKRNFSGIDLQIRSDQALYGKISTGQTLYFLP